MLVVRLSEAFPDDRILGEESVELPGTSGRIWIIDPMDGTMNFIRRGAGWSISIGLLKGEVSKMGILHQPLDDPTMAGQLELET